MGVAVKAKKLRLGCRPRASMHPPDIVLGGVVGGGVGFVLGGLGQGAAGEYLLELGDALAALAVVGLIYQHGVAALG